MHDRSGLETSATTVRHGFVHLNFRLPGRRVRSCAVLTVLALGFGACQTERRGFESTATPTAPSTYEAPPVPAGLPPRMMARDVFFNGTIEVEALVAARGAGGFDDGHGGRSGERPARSGDDGGLRMPGYGERRHGTEDAEEGRQHPGSLATSQHLRTTDAPAKQMRLGLTNRGSAPAVVEVIDFNSAFGNFAVQPDRFTLAPGQSAEAQPMISRLEVNGVELPLTVRLRIGEELDERVLTLRASEEAPADGQAPSPSAPGR